MKCENALTAGVFLILGFWIGFWSVEYFGGVRKNLWPETAAWEEDFRKFKNMLVDDKTERIGIIVITGKQFVVLQNLKQHLEIFAGVRDISSGNVLRRFNFEQWKHYRVNTQERIKKENL